MNEQFKEFFQKFIDDKEVWDDIFKSFPDVSFIFPDGDSAPFVGMKIFLSNEKDDFIQILTGFLYGNKYEYVTFRYINEKHMQAKDLFLLGHTLCVDKKEISDENFYTCFKETLKEFLKLIDLKLNLIEEDLKCQENQNQVQK